MVAQARRSNRKFFSGKNTPIKHGLREILLIFFCFVVLYLFVSLLTYSDGDPSIFGRSAPIEEITNKGGFIGALFADFFLYLFGYFSYLLPFMVGYLGWLIYKGRHYDILAEPKNLIVPGIGFVLTLSAGCGLAVLHFTPENVLLPTHTGGILGQGIANALVTIVDRLGASLILLAVFFTGITLLTGMSWLRLMDTLGYYTLSSLPIIKKFLDEQFLPWLKEHAKRLLQLAQSGLKFVQHWLKIFFFKLKIWFMKLPNLAKFGYAKWRELRGQYYEEDEDDYLIKGEPPILNSASHQSKLRPENFNIIPSEYSLLPALNLLESVPKFVPSPDVKRLSQRMKEAFNALQIKVDIQAVYPGPVLTGFEVNTSTPVNINQIDELSETLAKALSVPIVEIVANQSGMLEIEMPNFKRQIIYLSELLNSPEYHSNPSPLTVALGKNVSGQPVIVDITRIPHILIASSDHKEKTIAINTLILSFLYKSTPSAVRLLLIDSSCQNLSVYAELPHLLMPMITNLEQAPKALLWCVQEMERRYRLMANMGVRNIEDYNQARLLQDNQSILEPETESNATLFYIVVIINELAELMTTSLKQPVEQYLTRLTQKARAAGIHIIMATKSPAASVITGLINTNIPTCMAFKAANQSESRIILGQNGAEMLLGKGDMLYMMAGTKIPDRVHGSFVSDKEVQNVVADLIARATPDYLLDNL